VNESRDAGGKQSPRNKPTRKGDHDRPAETDEERDPDSPGATIDSPTPAEPNEPG
jgi:hypothetical protein